MLDESSCESKIIVQSNDNTNGIVQFAKDSVNVRGVEVSFKF